LPGT
jgi:hypothetical protein